MNEFAYKRKKGMIFLRQISKFEYDILKGKNLLKDRIIKNGSIIQDANYYVTNKQHKSKSKTYYIVEEYKLLKALGYTQEKKKYNNDR